jgi:hypothetical protein
MELESTRPASSIKRLISPLLAFQSFFLHHTQRIPALFRSSTTMAQVGSRAPGAGDNATILRAVVVTESWCYVDHDNTLRREVKDYGNEVRLMPGELGISVASRRVDPWGIEHRVRFRRYNIIFDGKLDPLVLFCEDCILIHISCCPGDSSEARRGIFLQQCKTRRLPRSLEVGAGSVGSLE